MFPCPKVKPCNSMRLVLKILFLLNPKSLSGNLSSLVKKFSQSLLSSYEILSFNYVKVSTNYQLGFIDLISLEKTQAS